MTERRPYVPTTKRALQIAEQLQYGQRILAQPQPGFYRVKLVKGGVWVGARITYGPTLDPETGEPLDRSWLYAGTINGEADPDPRPEPSDAVHRIWEHGERIDEATYQWLLDDRAWAAANEPHRPEANPKTPVDLSTMDPRLLL